jgi:ABC-type amino acid transport substrate-binding protein
MDLSRLAWRKASKSNSNGGDCVEVARSLADAVAVRDSKDPEGPKLVFPPGDWQAFMASVKAGRFDLG